MSENVDECERRYKNPEEGLRAVEEGFSYWTSKVTDIGFQCCIALVAANWALHGATLKANKAAIASIVFALLSAWWNLIASLFIAERCRWEYYRAVNDRTSWRHRWEASERIESEWPFTQVITDFGRYSSWIKVALPTISGVLLLASAR